jgi:hypothetical protein
VNHKESLPSEADAIAAAEAMADTFACFIAFVIVGWLVGAVFASVVRSQVIAGACVLFLAGAIALGFFALINVYDYYLLRTPAIALTFVIIPGAVGFVIGGISGVTR